MTTRRFLPISVLVHTALLLTIAASPTSASEVYAGIGFEPTDHPMHAEVGLGIGVTPTYEGSDEFAAVAAPLVNVNKPGAYFLNGISLNPNDGLLSGGISLLHAGYKNENDKGIRFTFGPYFRAHPGREQDADDKLLGLGDIDSSAGVGLFLNIQNARWAMQLAAAPLEVNESTDDGMLATLDLHFSVVQNSSWTLDTGITGSWANDEYMQAYYGINASQSAASGYSVYNAEAGMKDLGIYLKGDVQFTDNWNLHSQIGYWQLQGDAKNSPIVEAGSNNQVRLLIGASYRF